jgi:fibronectin-binding autotransporter adhesin
MGEAERKHNTCKYVRSNSGKTELRIVKYLSLAATAFATRAAFAAGTDTWLGNGSANWSTGGWTNDSPPLNTDTIDFGAPGSSPTSLIDDLSPTVTLDNINFLANSSTPSYSISGNTLTLSSGANQGITNNSSNLQTISDNLAFTANQYVNMASGNVDLSGNMSGATFTLVKLGSGSLELTGTNSYTGATSIGANITNTTGATASTTYGSGTLDLNFNAGGATPTNNIISSGDGLNMGGGTLEIDGSSGGSNTQSFGVLSVFAGFSTINLVPGSSGNTVTMSTTTWAAGSSGEDSKAVQLNIILPTGATMTTTQPNGSSSQETGLLAVGTTMADVTVNSVSWAVNSGGNVAALPTASYTDETSSGVVAGSGVATQLDFVTDSTFTATQTAGTIRFNMPDGTGLTNTLNVAGKTLTLDSGAVLVTPNVGASNVTITGTASSGTDFLRGSSNRGLVIFQYDTQNSLIIDLPIVNNGTGANALSIGGGGLVSMTANAVNTYTDSTMINGGTLEIVQNSNLGAVATGAAVNLNGGTLEANSTAGSFALSTAGVNRAVGLGSLSGTFEVIGGNTLSIPGIITSQQGIAGVGGITISGNGTVSLGGANTYIGPTNVSSGGTLALATGSSLTDTAISVASGATLLAAAGTTAGTTVTTGITTAIPGATLSLAAGSNLNLADGTIGNFNLTQASSFTTAATALTLNGANLDFDLGSSSTDSIVVNTGSVNATSGTNTVNLSLVAGTTSLTPGTYHLISAAAGTVTDNSTAFEFSNSSTSEALMVGAKSYLLTLVDPAHSVDLDIALNHSASAVFATGNSAPAGYSNEFVGTSNPGGHGPLSVIYVTGGSGAYSPGYLNNIANNPATGGAKDYVEIDGFSNSDTEVAALALTVTDGSGTHEVTSQELTDIISDLNASDPGSIVAEPFSSLSADVQNTLTANDGDSTPLDLAFVLSAGLNPGSPQVVGVDFSNETVDGITNLQVTDIAVVPEPAAGIAMLGVGTLGLLARRRRRELTEKISAGGSGR